MSHKGGSTVSAVRDWLDSAHRALTEHTDVLNDLNVFPVADSDTGVNLSTTVGYATEAAQLIEGNDIGELLQHAGRTAMEQARGNSGVLMALTLTAMGTSLEGATRVTAGELRDALSAAQVRCWSALTDPVEGTMISVLDVVSKVSVPENSQDGSNQQLSDWMDLVIARGSHAVIDTVEQLPVLHERGTVDSGALGMLIVLVELRAALTGDEQRYNPVPDIIRDYSDHTGHQDKRDCVGFEVMCTVQLSALDAAELRHELDSAGDSVLVSAVSESDNDNYTWRVHVHVAEPEEALALMRARGHAVNVSVTPLGSDDHRVFP